MKVMKKLPGEAWQLVEMEKSEEALQEVVGDSMELKGICSDLCLAYNAESQRRPTSKDYNCNLLGLGLMGPLLLIGRKGRNMVDVPPTAIRWLADQRKNK